jgi:hypothetical protein
VLLDRWRRDAGRTPAKNGLIEPPPPRFRREDRVGVLYVRLPAKSDSSPVAVLLTLLGSSRWPGEAVERVGLTRLRLSKRQ